MGFFWSFSEQKKTTVGIFICNSWTKKHGTTQPVTPQTPQPNLPCNVTFRKKQPALLTVFYQPPWFLFNHPIIITPDFLAIRSIGRFGAPSNFPWKPTCPVFIRRRCLQHAEQDPMALRAAVQPITVVIGLIARLRRVGLLGKSSVEVEKVGGVKDVCFWWFWWVFDGFDDFGSFLDGSFDVVSCLVLTTLCWWPEIFGGIFGSSPMSWALRQAEMPT